MEFNTNPRLAEMTEKLVALAVSIGRGGILSHEEITRVSGFTRNSPEWKTLIHKLWKTLTLPPHGLTIRSARNVGYRICDIDEQLNATVFRLERSVRQINRGKRELAGIDNSQLSIHEQVKRQAGMQYLNNNRNQLNWQMRQFSKSYRTETVPLRPREGEAQAG